MTETWTGNLGSANATEQWPRILLLALRKWQRALVEVSRYQLQKEKFRGVPSVGPTGRLIGPVSRPVLALIIQVDCFSATEGLSYI